MSHIATSSAPPFTSNGTECQIMNLGFIAINPPEQIKAHRDTAQDALDRFDAERMTPSSGRAQEIGQKVPPS